MTVREGKIKAEAYVKSIYPAGGHVTNCLAVNDGFIFTVYPNDLKNGAVPQDPFFKVYSTGEVKEYPFIAHKEEFLGGKQVHV